MVQIAEQVTVPKTIEATLSYFVDTEAMPVTLVGAPGGSDQRVGGGTSATGFVLSDTTPKSAISSTRTKCAGSTTRRWKR